MLVLVLLTLREVWKLPSRKKRKSGRSATRLPAVMPRLASTFDHIEMLAVASGKGDAVSTVVDEEESW